MPKRVSAKSGKPRIRGAGGHPGPQRLPLGRLRDLLAALRAYGRVFGLVQRGSEVVLGAVNEAGPVRLARRLPTVGPPEPILPPADALFGPRAPLPSVHEAGRDGGRVVLFALPPCLVYSVRFVDRLLASGPFRDAEYAARRSRCLVVAMNCTKQRRRCYCAGLAIGPALRSSSHADIALIPAGSGFIVESGSALGAKILGGLNLMAGSTI